MQAVETALIRKARRYAASQYRKLRDQSDPQWYRFHGHCSHAASEAIRRAGERFDIGHGCEGFALPCENDGISYLNMGDTYATTIIFDSRTEQFRVGCYGDVVEALELQGITLD